MKISLLKHGIINLFIFIPIWILTSFLSIIIGVGVCVELLGFDTIPEFALIMCLFPLAIAPLSCICGIIKGIIHKREKNAILCMVLSCIGFIIFCFSLYGIFYIGSRF